MGKAATKTSKGKKSEATSKGENGLSAFDLDVLTFAEKHGCDDPKMALRVLDEYLKTGKSKIDADLLDSICRKECLVGLQKMLESLEVVPTPPTPPETLYFALLKTSKDSADRNEKMLRGQRLSEAFFQFVKEAGLDLDSNISMDQVEQTLISFKIPCPDFSKTAFQLADFLNYWEPGLCGEWFSTLWECGNEGVEELRLNKNWSTCCMKLFLPIWRRDPDESERMRCRLCLSWAFALEWWKFDREQNVESKPKGQAYPKEVVDLIVNIAKNGFSKGLKWKGIMERVLDTGIPQKHGILSLTRETCAKKVNDYELETGEIIEPKRGRPVGS